MDYAITHLQHVAERAMIFLRIEYGWVDTVVRRVNLAAGDRRVRLGAFGDAPAITEVKYALSVCCPLVNCAVSKVTSARVH